MKLNFFDNESPYFPFRWFIVIALSLTVFMTWHDLTGGRMFVFSSQQQWSSSGPGYHK